MKRLLPLLVLLLAACQPVPRPFVDDHPPARSPILSPPDSAGIMVLPVANAPASLAQPIAEAMAAALRDADVPASTEAQNRGSYRLSGTAHEQPGAMLAIDWELRNAKGEVVGRRSASAAETGGGQAVAAALTRPAAPELAKLVQGDAPLPALGIDPLVAVSGVTGAPGDGGKALPRAIGDALRRAHVALAEKPGDKESFVLAGHVEMAPPASGKQQVKVQWVLSRADGSPVGQVNQENAVAAGSLDSAWGDVAFAVANAAVPGITSLIERAKLADAAH